MSKTKQGTKQQSRPGDKAGTPPQRRRAGSAKGPTATAAEPVLPPVTSYSYEVDQATEGSPAVLAAGPLVTSYVYDNQNRLSRQFDGPATLEQIMAPAPPARRGKRKATASAGRAAKARR